MTEAVKTYNKRPGYQLRNTAEVVGRNLERIEAEYGSLTPENVLKAASKVKHPLHNEFIWDDAEAANKQRLARAAYLIRSINISVTVVEKDKEETVVRVRAYLGVKREGKKKRDYVSRSKLDRDAEAKALVVEDVKKQLFYLRDKHRELDKQFLPVWEAIDKLEGDK